MRLTETEKNYLIENAGKLTDKELAVGLKKLTGFTVTVAAVKTARHSLGLKGRDPGRPSRWASTPEESFKGTIRVTIEGDPLLLSRFLEQIQNKKGA